MPAVVVTVSPALPVALSVTLAVAVPALPSIGPKSQVTTPESWLQLPWVASAETMLAAAGTAIVTATAGDA